MVTELATIEVKEGLEGEFERGVANAKPLFLAAVGCRSLRLWKSVEQPRQYHLVVVWSSMEDHTVTFRSSPAFNEWRRLVGECFASSPQVEHQSRVELV